jgi:hypothetical protein
MQTQMGYKQDPGKVSWHRVSRNLSPDADRGERAASPYHDSPGSEGGAIARRL